MKPSQLLREKGWCQYIYAEDAKGTAVNCREMSAMSFCMIGAIGAIYHDTTTVREIRDKLDKYLGHPHASWNDDPSRTKDEVIAALEAIGE